MTFGGSHASGSGVLALLAFWRYSLVSSRRRPRGPIRGLGRPHLGLDLSELEVVSQRCREPARRDVTEGPTRWQDRESA